MWQSVAKLRLIYFDLHGLRLTFWDLRLILKETTWTKVLSQSKVIAWPFKFEKERLNTKEKNSTFLTMLLG